MTFDLQTLAAATDLYARLRQEGYSHDGAIHQGAVILKNDGKYDYRDATELMREAAHDC